MHSFLITLLECSVSMTVIGIIYMAVTPLLQNRFTAKGRYYGWLVIVIGFIVPFRFHLPVSIISMDTLFPTLGSTGPSNLNPLTAAAFPGITATAFPWLSVAVGVWMTGVVVFVAWHMVRHRRLLRLIKRWNENSNDKQALRLLQQIKVELNVTRHVDLRICPAISSPMLVGLVHPVILLPSNRLSIQALRFILKHELIHLKRKDLGYKLLIFTAAALHWFNPFVYRMAREIAIQCELSCDEAVVMHSDMNNRQQYVETIINVVRNQSIGRSAFSTSFSDNKLSLKKRVYSIMDTRGKKWGFSLLIVISLAAVGTGVVLQLNSAQPETALPASSIQAAANEIVSNQEGSDPEGSALPSPVASPVASPVPSSSPIKEDHPVNELKKEETGAVLREGVGDDVKSKSDSASNEPVLKSTTQSMLPELRESKK
ncbi:M56 family metallopeptidase [Paenibacillus sp. sgz500992]|uniref:M56 family metallopeptidase n=1 Tax=Paenibacillus sp. sgz500992 TaxID=3242476 RepID=UPI0036D3A6AF